MYVQGYREDDGLLLESDTDEQLLIHIPFNQKVRSRVVGSLAAGSKPTKLMLRLCLAGLTDWQQLLLTATALPTSLAMGGRR